MKILLYIVGAIIILFIVMLRWGTLGMKELRALKVSPIDPTSKPDGVYHGSYTSGRWTNEVNVTIKDHRITDIVATKPSMGTKPEFNTKLFTEVIAKQNTDIDIVTGATMSTKATLAAIKNAFN